MDCEDDILVCSVGEWGGDGEGVGGQFIGLVGVLGDGDGGELSEGEEVGEGSRGNEGVS